MHVHESREMDASFSSAPAASTIPMDPWAVAQLGCCIPSIGKDVLAAKYLSNAGDLAWLKEHTGRSDYKLQQAVSRVLIRRVLEDHPP
jgi:hypothetical protein